MKYEGAILNNEKDICNAFNKFFHENFSEPAISYLSYKPTYNTVNHNDTICNLELSSTYTLKLLQTLDSNKGPGCDRIPPYSSKIVLRHLLALYRIFLIGVYVKEAVLVYGKGLSLYQFQRKVLKLT